MNDKDHINEAKQLFRQRKYRQVIETLNKAEKSKKINSMIYKLRGYAYYKLSNFKKAILDYNTAERLDQTKDETLFNNRGLAYSKMGKCKPALLDFNQALKIKPRYPQAMNNLANCSDILGKKAQACRYWRKAAFMGYQAAYRMYKLKCK